METVDSTKDAQTQEKIPKEDKSTEDLSQEDINNDALSTEGNLSQKTESIEQKEKINESDDEINIDLDKNLNMTVRIGSLLHTQVITGELF